ncbi:MAG: hypothetical protein ACXABD_16065 [Candidatus Thorarchaeota archaeon]
MRCKTPPTLSQFRKNVPIIQSVTNEIRDNSTVITFIGDVDNNGYTFEDSNGSRWLFCKSITETGDVTVGADALVPSIRIDDITHEIVAPFNYPAKSFTHGNALTRVKTTIDFTYLNSFASLGYQFGFVANSTNLFPNATNGNYQIDPTYFTDVITSTAQAFNAPGFADAVPESPTSWNTGQATVTSTGASTGRIEHQYNLPVKLWEELFQSDTGSQAVDKPDVLLRESLKYCCQIDLRASITDVDPVESTATQDTRPFFPKGNIGWFGSIWSTGPSFVSVGAVTWDTPEGVLDAGRTSVCNVEIVSPGSISGQAYSLKIQSLISPNASGDYADITDFSTVEGTVNGGAVSGGNFATCEVSQVSGQDAVLTFTVNPTIYTDRYIVWLEVENGEYQNQNLLIDVNSAFTGVDDSFIQFFGGIDEQYAFTAQYTIDALQGFKEVRGAVEDYITARWGVESTDAGTEITAINIRVQSIAGGGVQSGESFSFSKEEMEAGLIQIDRGFSIPENDIALRRFIIVDDQGTGINFQFPFQLQESYDGLSLVCEVEFTQTVATGEVLSGRRAFYSPPFEVSGYNETLADDVSEPIIGPSSLPQTSNGFFLEDANTGALLNTIPKDPGSLVAVTCVFENATNVFPDFNQQPPAPFEYDGGTNEDYLCGFITVTDGSKSFQFRTYGVNEDNPIVSGVNNPVIADARTDVNSGPLNFQIRGVFNVDELIKFFGDFECLTFTARMNKVQTPT